jgi:hypothetical protein
MVFTSESCNFHPFTTYCELNLLLGGGWGTGNANRVDNLTSNTWLQIFKDEV